MKKNYDICPLIAVADLRLESCINANSNYVDENGNLVTSDVIEGADANDACAKENSWGNTWGENKESNVLW